MELVGGGGGEGLPCLLGIRNWSDSLYNLDIHKIPFDVSIHKLRQKNKYHGIVRRIRVYLLSSAIQ